MIRPALTSFLIFVVLGFAPLASAQDIGIDVYKAALLDLNRSPITQNPTFSTGRDVLSRRLLDKNQKTIGKIEDIILSPDGRFQTIEANINTGGFRENVSFDVQSYVVDPTISSFTVAMDKAQINDNMPQFLAGIETAAGEEAPLTLNQLRGANILDPKKNSIAKVQDALVRDNANQVEALLIKVSLGKNRGTTMAIPYEAAEVISNGPRVDLVLVEEQALAITSLAPR